MTTDTAAKPLVTDPLKPLPCPFCGSRDVREFYVRSTAGRIRRAEREPDCFSGDRRRTSRCDYTIKCFDCHASGPFSTNLADAITDWNAALRPHVECTCPNQVQL
jgi:hypothetical protein